METTTSAKGGWDFLSEFLKGDNSAVILFLLVFILIIFVVIVIGIKHGIKHGFIHLDFKGVKVGGDEVERNIIRRQIEWVHLYIMSLKSKIEADENRFGGYFTKYVLERCFDKIVEWITFNHISKNDAYVEIKQEEICALVYGLGVSEEFKTPEFKERICKWVREIIEHLIQIREIYSQEGLANGK